MRKLNATLLNEGNKEEAILKIKDDSFAINTIDQLIKIPYSNVKGYNYDESNGVLSIVRFGGSPIELNIVKDKQLLELLNSITSKNKSDSNESIPTYESNSPKENEKELERNATIRDTDSKKTEVKQNNENKKESTNNDGIIGVIAVIVIIVVVFWGISKTGVFNSFNRSPVGTWHNEGGTVIKINKDGSCEVAFSEKDDYIKKLKKKYDWGEVKVLKCEWKKDFNDENKASVSVLMKYGEMEFSDTLINTWVHSNDWGGFKRK